MSKKVLFLMIFPVLVIALAGVSYGWQGRMGGMGDPYALVQDESDFLTHPAKIAKGEGVRFYGDYRFTYTGVSSWDYGLDVFNTAGTLLDYFHYDGSGQEYKHNVLVGASFPLGSGRMGAFFAYDGMRGNYDGNGDRLGILNYAEYNLSKNLDNFALRLLYGLPVEGSFKVGGEVQLAYRQEEQAHWIYDTGTTIKMLNFPWGGNRQMYNLFPFMLPYDSHYWEALFKGSLEGKAGPLDLEFTLRGGFTFAGDNKWAYDYQDPIGTSTAGVNMDGAVHGWRLGGDLWLRYPMSEGLTLPFLVRVDYQSKTRDGDGEGYGNLTGFPYNYEHQETNLQIEVGGGLDKEFDKGSRVAAGIYYNYLQSRENLAISGDEGRGVFTYDYSDYPASSEHRVIVKLAGELALSPAVTLRMGLVPFFGWVKEDFKFTTDVALPLADDISLNGFRWGIGASLGGTIKFKPITLEPFINFNYQQVKLDGDGDRISGGAVTRLYEMDKSRGEWSIGGGFSLLFDLP